MVAGVKKKICTKNNMKKISILVLVAGANK
jgi:hypothetical protein